MKAYFTTDKFSRLYFLWCDSLRIINEGDGIRLKDLKIATGVGGNVSSN